MNIQTINPATEEIIETYPVLNDKEIEARIEAGHAAFENWKHSDFQHRQTLMKNLASLLLNKKDELAMLMTQEMGKPISQSKGEIEKCAWVCEYYADHAQDFLKPHSIDTEYKVSKVCYLPIGIVFAIMPWNYPFWQVFRFAAPTIMAGNAAILKHAPISSGTGNKIADLFLEAGFPEHLFQHMILDNDGAAKVIAHEKIAAVTLTGSERAGRAVASNAGEHLKKSVLELGGCDPYLILADADLDQAAKSIAASRLNNCGQTCISAKRIIADESVVDDLTAKIQALMLDFKMDDPSKETTRMGPMARADLRDELHRQVVKSRSLGAQLLQGGEIPERTGFYYPATLLTNVKPGMPAFDEELFGPVISIITVSSEEEAIRLANQSPYGLGAAVFSKDVKKAEKIASEQLDAGCCFVNDYVVSDPRLPFGGTKLSGYGRELSREGILEFVNAKTVVVSEK